MSAPEIGRVSSELLFPGYSLTSFDALGLGLSLNDVDELCTMVDASAGSDAALEAVKHIEKQGMTIIQDDDCVNRGMQLMDPAVKTLFAGTDGGEGWSLFGINRYAAGATFGPHVDNVGKTVLIMTLRGERILDIHEKIEDKREEEGYIFGRVLDTIALRLGSIMILDRDADPGHAVRISLTDSISMVADVPGILRPWGNE